MKVSLNIKFIDGPFGGAMQFAKTFREYLERQHVEVVTTLEDDNIDVIFHIVPFPHMEISSYSFLDAAEYKRSHPKAKIILRINECDERKGTHHMNPLIIQASRYSDHIIYIASWLRPLFENQGLNPIIPSSVILNGADNAIFHNRDKLPWNGTEKMKIVTHHFGGNYMKGHDMYQKLERLLSRKEFSDMFEFTFIGNIPENTSYERTSVIAPLSGMALGDELRRHHIYITATRNEPAGMHHVEGALCGLPLLYLESGALPEYCHEYGVGFTEENFVEKLHELRSRYHEFLKNLETYPNTSDHMNAGYYQSTLEVFNRVTNLGKIQEPVFLFSVKKLLLTLNCFAIRIHDYLHGRLMKFYKK